MKMKSKNFLLALLVVFISSCEPLEYQSPFPVELQESNTELLEVSKSSLIIEPESFIADNQDRVIATALSGPIIDVESSEAVIAKSTIRKQINKEEVKNNIDVSSGSNKEEIFTISVNFENMPIEYMSVMFAEVSGRNIMIGDEVSGLVSAKLTDVPWDKALDSILKVKQLAKYVDDEANIIRIHSQEVLAAQEKYDLEIMQAMEKTRNAQDAVQPLYTEIFKLYYTEAKNVSTEIQSIINGPESGEGEEVSSAIEITIDERLNYLIVKATESDLNFIQRIISELDVRTKQILIEAFIVEASESLGRSLGADFAINSPDTNILGFRDNFRGDNALGITGSTLGAPDAGTSAISFILGTTTKNLSAALAASEDQGITKVLSNPRVFTLDGQAAEIKQVDQVPYTKVEDGVTSIELKDAGITLKVTPVIVGDGNIILSVDVEKSTVDTTIANPPIAKRTISTKLLIKDETIVVIGGVFTESTKSSKTQTPFLADLPLVGDLFKGEEKTNVRKELLVFLAPRII